MNRPNIIALLGPTASGKSALSIEIALKSDAVILSLDSLAVYREFDIVSAKPTPIEMGEILHFGIDILDATESFGIQYYIDEFKSCWEYAKKNNKNIVIVGGTSFYLKMLIEGFDTQNSISEEAKMLAKEEIRVGNGYGKLTQIDPKYASKISANDSYRIEKALEAYFHSGKSPSSFFENKNNPVIENVALYAIDVENSILKKRIKERTKSMLSQGLIDEIAYLEHKYGRAPNAMGAIGVKEVLGYFDGRLDYKEVEERIATNTYHLGKRQITFNKSQFKTITYGSVDELRELII